MIISQVGVEFCVRTDREKMRSYFKSKKIVDIPRLPLEGSFDLTYRCNNNCRHCWLRIPADAGDKDRELSIEEIKRIIDDARKMGCRRWSISGGEPLLRPDFPEIFDYVTSKTSSYFINTNGTLITPEIARLMTRKGRKMVALYGATEDVYDHITRHPGGFEMAMRGIERLKEAGAGFVVQLIPMKDNWHQWKKMIDLAKRLSRHWRIGAPWLYLSGGCSAQKNREIAAQRLSPSDVIGLDPPSLTYKERMAEEEPTRYPANREDDRLFARCISIRRDFHIDPYGGMSWCQFIKDPALRYDLGNGSFEEAWNIFIPSCADKVRGGEEYRKHCGSCDKRSDCRWCAAYAYLECGRYSAPVPYLCAVAEESRSCKREWQEKHRRYFRVAEITVRIESDLDFDKIRFKDELMKFAADGPGGDNVTFRHYFEPPDLKDRSLGKEIYRRTPWAISRKGQNWIYQGISPEEGEDEPYQIAIFNAEHTRATIYNPAWRKEQLLTGSWDSLSLFPTDQIWLARLLADRQAVLIHSAAAILNRKGFVFVGHSETGKSTTMELLKSANQERGLQVEILCDDRNVIRKREGDWRVYGTWSHGSTADVSPSSAPLAAVLFLKQASANEIEPLTDRKKLWKGLLETLIRPMVTGEWWQKELDILEQIVLEIPCYTMRFDKSGDIVPRLVNLERMKDNRLHEGTER